MKIISDLGKFFFTKLEILGNRIFTPAFNPFYFLGGISFHLLYLLFISGAYLLFYYQISVTGSYESLKYLMEEQWYLGGVMRSLHRYATDALMLTMALHLLREFFNDKYRFYRWVAWVSGVGLLFSIWITALIGYWMAWDAKAQVIALFTSELMDYLIYLNEPMSISFLAPSTLSDIFFFVILFFHVSVPTFLLFVAWLHYARISKPQVNPPMALSLGILLILVSLAFLQPAPLDPPANLAKTPVTIGLDWFVMVFFPLMASSDAGTVWSVIGGLFLLLFILPWIPGRKKLPTAAIDLENCIGCELCHADCPYEAVKMEARTDDKPFDMQAKIMDSRCAGCGICLGSCDSNAIRMASWTNEGLNQETKQSLARTASDTGPHILALVCDEGPKIREILDPSGKTLKDLPGVRIQSLPCVGMINSSLIEGAFKAGADGVFISACGEGECHYRLGNLWLKERMEGVRPPALRRGVDRQKVKIWFAPEIDGENFLRETRAFMDDLKAGKPQAAPFGKKKPILALAALALCLPALLIAPLSNTPVSLFDGEKAILKLGFKHKTPRLHECTDEEVREYERARVTQLPGSKKVSSHMDFRPQGETYCGKRERNPSTVQVTVDGKLLFSKTYFPSGWNRDGSIFLYEKFILDPGEHDVLIQMRDSASAEGFDYEFRQRIHWDKGEVKALTFDKSALGFKVMH